MKDNCPSIEIKLLKSVYKKDGHKYKLLNTSELNILNNANLLKIIMIQFLPRSVRISVWIYFLKKKPPLTI